MSENIAAFLNFLHEAEQLLHMAEADEQEANAQAQDILHAIELQDVDYHGMAKLAKRLKAVREARRTAKDLIMEVTPIVEWIDNNRNFIKSLERILGEIRKVEKNKSTRIYTPKTDILED